MSRRRRATIYDVARHAGVSIATVSRHIKGFTAISGPTRQRVEEAIRKLSYHPSIVATSLALRRRHSVGLIVPGGQRAYADLFLSEILSGVTAAATKAGWSVHLSMLNPGVDPARLLEHHADLVDGSLVLDKALDHPAVASLVRKGHTAIAVNRTHPDLPWVAFNNEAGTRLAIEHLLSLGHTRIACFGEARGVGGERLRGYAAALARARLKPVALVDARMQRGTAARETVRLLAIRQPPTALAFASDWMATGGLNAARAAGVIVPGDLSLIGFDDALIAEIAAPALTTIRQPLAEMGERAFALFIGSLDPSRKKRAAARTLLEPTLVVRNSTSARPRR